MYKKLFFLLVGFSGFFNVFSQQNRDTLRLFYAINETQSQLNNAKLDSFIKKLNPKNIQLSIFGYADYLHNTSYNLALSQKRADAVKNYLLKNHYSKVTIHGCKGIGEKFSAERDSKEGEGFQRRVDVVLLRMIPIKESDTRPVQGVFETVKKEDVKREMEQLSVGESLVLEGLSFIPGRHTVMKESEPILKKLLSTLKKNKTLKIEIHGHVCCNDGIGDDAMDYDAKKERKLSHNRAKAVYEYLVANGIEKQRLTYMGFGYTKPRVSPERTPEEEQMNRRVEIVVVEN